MKKAVIAAGLVLVTVLAYAQEAKLSIANYRINEKDITAEYEKANIKWGFKKVITKNSYGEDREVDTYEIEVKLYKTNTGLTETIIVTEGLYSGGYNSFTFGKVIFPRIPEMAFSSDYGEGLEDDYKVFHFYDKSSESKRPYATLILR